MGILALLAWLLVGCATVKPCEPRIEYQVVEKPIPIPCPQPPEVREPELWLPSADIMSMAPDEILLMLIHDIEQLWTSYQEQRLILDTYRNQPALGEAPPPPATP
jgi:hypothetical protein